MSAGAVTCSSCGYENVVIGCGFCLQCGTEFPTSAAIENESVASEPQSTQNQAAASNETIAPIATSADEALVATATEANSQCVGFVDHKYSDNDTSEEVNFDSTNPSDEIDALPSVELPEQENDSFLAKSADRAEEPAEAAVDCDEQPGDCRAVVAELADEAVGADNGATSPVADPTDLVDEAVEQEAERSEVVDEFVPASQSVETVAAAAETADVGAETAEESVEPASESQSTQMESANDTAFEAEQTDGNAESAPNNDAETDVVEVETVEQISFSDALGQELDRLIATAAKSIDMQMSSLELGMVGELEVEGCTQHIYVQRNYSSNGAPLLSFFAACGPALQQHALPLLEWNSALPMCAFAIREIENTQMFVVQANVPAFSLDQSIIAATFKEIAKRADQVRKRIG